MSMPGRHSTTGLVSPDLRVGYCVSLLLVVAVMIVSGCGGSSTGVSPLPLGHGRIIGTVSDSQLSGTRGPASSDIVTVTLDGTDLSVETVFGRAFALENVPMGLHTLVAQTSTRACATVLTVESGETTNVGMLQLRNAGRVSGVVTTRSGEPIAGALVKIRHQSIIGGYEGFPEPVRHVYTDASGAYTIAGLAVDDDTLGFGDYDVRITKPGMVVFDDMVGIWWYEDTIRIYAGNTTPYGLQMIALPDVESGTVIVKVYFKTKDGIAPLSGVIVTLSTPAAATSPVQEEPSPIPPEPEPLPPGPIAWAGSDTGPDGTSRFERVPVGEYTLSVIRYGVGESSQQVTVSPGGTVEAEVVLAMKPPETCIVDGVVRSRLTKEPRAGIIVVAFRQSESAFTTGIVITPDDVILLDSTDDDGSFHLVIPVQANTLVAHSGPGGGWKEVTISPTPNGHLNVHIEIDF